MHMHKNLTLASGSQVRAELLRGAGLTFDVAVSVVCLLSLLLCGRSIIRGIILQQVS